MCKDIIELERAMDIEYSFEDDAELVAIEESMKKTNEEIKKLSIFQDDFDEDENNKSKSEEYSKSVCVGNLAHGTTSVMLEAIFSRCGIIKRVTIPLNKITGKPKGFAYIDFELLSSVEKALKMNGFKLRCMPLQVMSNKTRLTTTNRPILVSTIPRNNKMSAVDSMKVSEHFKSICSIDNVTFKSKKISGIMKTKYSVKRLGLF